MRNIRHSVRAATLVFPCAYRSRSDHDPDLGDIGATFYPRLGAYRHVTSTRGILNLFVFSSRDPIVYKDHMVQMASVPLSRFIAELLICRLLPALGPLFCPGLRRAVETHGRKTLTA